MCNHASLNQDANISRKSRPYNASVLLQSRGYGGVYQQSPQDSPYDFEISPSIKIPKEQYVLL